MQIVNESSITITTFDDLQVGDLFKLNIESDYHVYYKTYSTKPTETGSERNCVDLSTGLIKYISLSAPVIKYLKLILRREE